MTTCLPAAQFTQPPVSRPYCPQIRSVDFGVARYTVKSTGSASTRWKDRSPPTAQPRRVSPSTASTSAANCAGVTFSPFSARTLYR